MLVNEKTHEFRNRNGWVGIVQLNGEAFRELLDCPIAHEGKPYHVLEGATDKEILLDEPELAADLRLIIGV